MYADRSSKDIRRNRAQKFILRSAELVVDALGIDTSVSHGGSRHPDGPKHLGLPRVEYSV